MENHVKKNGFNVPYLNVEGRTSVRASAPGGSVQLADAKEKDVIISRRTGNSDTQARLISSEAVSWHNIREQLLEMGAVLPEPSR